jgi:hypothetical protein
MYMYLMECFQTMIYLISLLEIGMLHQLNIWKVCFIMLSHLIRIYQIGMLVMLLICLVCL